MQSNQTKIFFYLYIYYDENKALYNPPSQSTIIILQFVHIWRMVRHRFHLFKMYLEIKSWKPATQLAFH